MERSPDRLARLAVRLDSRAQRMQCMCGGNTPDTYWSGEKTAATARKLARLLRARLARAGHVQPLYIYVRGVDRRYGGPEEGGWYYDMGQILTVRRAYSWRQALRFVRELREEYPTCPRGRHSVIGGTDVYVRVVAHEDAIPEDSDHPGPYC